MAFLHIHLHGLLNIFESADMLLFGFLISAITHQISKEVVPGYDAEKRRKLGLQLVGDETGVQRPNPLADQ